MYYFFTNKVRKNEKNILPPPFGLSDCESMGYGVFCKINKLVLILVMFLTYYAASGATWTVNSIADAEAGNATNKTGTLRYCINNAATGDVINVAPALAGKTIRLDATQAGGMGTSGDQGWVFLSVGRSITLNGNGIILDNFTNRDGCRIMNFTGGGTSTINNVTFYGGRGLTFGGAVGIHNTNVTFNDCNFINNYVSTNKQSHDHHGGGAINICGGKLELNRCNFLNNDIGGNNERGMHIMLRCSATMSTTDTYFYGGKNRGDATYYINVHGAGTNGWYGTGGGQQDDNTAGKSDTYHWLVNASGASDKIIAFCNPFTKEIRVVGAGATIDGARLENKQIAGTGASSNSNQLWL
jgi:hypothetical protein